MRSFTAPGSAIRYSARVRTVTRPTPRGVALLLLLLLGGACGGASPSSSSGAAATSTPVIGPDGQPLGSVRFPTSCAQETQPSLELGLALLHNMTYLESERAFGRAAAADPDCALAYWGQAMTRLHPLWPDVPTQDDMAFARERLQRAAAAAHTSERETGYVEASLAYFDDGANRSELQRLSAFHTAWSRVRDAHPDDLEAALFSALAHLATADAADKTYATQRAAGAAVEAVLADIPDHPGALHYLIHAYDVPSLATLALDAARRYGEAAPENSHALHMTSHIFTRLGLWPESRDYNERAAAAATERTAEGAVPMHHMHALDYLVYAHLQTADDEAAVDVLQHVRSLTPPFQDHAGTAYAFAAIPARLALERRDWSGAASLETEWPADIPWDRYPHLVAIPVFARALGAARAGDEATAEAAITRLAALQSDAASVPDAYDWEIQVAIQRTAAEAWLAHARGETEDGLRLMRQAAAMELGTEKNPVTPGSVLPATELYGDMLVEARRWEDAAMQYAITLERSPQRFHSLYGAGLAAELGGATAVADERYRTLLANCAGSAGTRPSLEHARDFVTGH